MVAGWLSVVCGLGVAVLLAAEARGGLRARAAAKAVASASFVAIGVLRFGGAGPEQWLLAALVLGAVGDVLLTGEKTFDLGLLAFLADHVLLIVAFLQLRPIAAWWPLPLLGLVPVAAVVLRWLWPHLGRRRIPVTAYVTAIMLMVWGALAAAHAGALPWWVGAAALLFMLSDIAVARQRFIHPGLVNRVIGLPMYYAAQLLFAFLIGTF